MNRRSFLTKGGATAISLALPGSLAGCVSSAPSFQPTGPLNTKGRNYEFQLNYIPSYGQSLCLGVDGQPRISKQQRFDSLMFAGGTRAQGKSQDIASVYGSAVPLVESNVLIDTDNPASAIYGAGYFGETPLSGLTEAVKELMETEDNATPQNFPDFRLLGSACGRGGQGILDLWQGSEPYALLLYEVKAAAAIAKQMGLTFGVPVVTWMQGEADICCNVPGHYAGFLTQLITAQFAVDIPAITGQKNAPLFLMYQTGEAGGFEIACEQLQVAQTVPNTAMATPVYPFQNLHTPHLTAYSYKEMGAYFGAAFKKIAVNGESWLPLSPKSVSANGNTITVTLNVPQGPVVADTMNTTSTNPAKAAYGFSLYDANGNLLDIDNAVAINAQNQIVIQTPEPVAAGFQLRYGDEVDGTSGGNIHDSQGSSYVFNGGDLDYPMNNWLVMFRHTF